MYICTLKTNACLGKIYGEVALPKVIGRLEQNKNGEVAQLVRAQDS